MNITFLIGNGFDLGLGLKTQYEDFYDSYYKNTDGDNENIIAFKSLLASWNKNKKTKIIDWSDFERAFGQHSIDFTIEQKNLYLERFEDFVYKFNEYLEKEEGTLEYQDVETIAKTMKNAVSQYYYVRKGDKHEIQEAVNNYNGKTTVNFVSFNYMYSVDKCATIFKESLKNDVSLGVGNIVHIHGYIDSNMIMGVNDASQITNPDFAKDDDILKEIVKPIQNTEIKSRYESMLIDVINASHIICIYGMSLGETDKKWWDMISKWLTANNLRHLLILKYDNNYNERFPHLQIKKTDNIIEKFLSYSTLAVTVKEVIKKRIHVGFNHNVFAMKLRKEEIIKVDRDHEQFDIVFKNQKSNSTWKVS